jgi:hypothetical protein
MDWVKGKITEFTLTAAIGLAALQVITPMFVDMIFDGLIIGLLYVAGKMK